MRHPSKDTSQEFFFMVDDINRLSCSVVIGTLSTFVNRVDKGSLSSIGIIKSFGLVLCIFHLDVFTVENLNGNKR